MFEKLRNLLRRRPEMETAPTVEGPKRACGTGARRGATRPPLGSVRLVNRRRDRNARRARRVNR